MVKAPEHNTRNEAIRAVVEAISQATPLSSAVARIFQFTNPTQYEKEREIWTSEITDRVNKHEDRIELFYDYLFPKISISPNALAVAKILIDASEVGFGDVLEFEYLVPLLPDIDESDIESAISELQYHKFVKYEGGEVIEYNLSLFVVFDAIFNNIDVEGDAKLLANLIIGNDENKDVYKLFEQSKLQHRRFNPALAYLLDSVPQINAGTEKVSDFITPYLFFDSNAMFALKEFVNAELSEYK